MEEQTSKELISALFRRVREKDRSCTQPEFKRLFEELPAVQADLEKSRHFVRMLRAYYQWTSDHLSLKDGQTHCLAARIQELDDVQMALDGNQMQFDAAGDAIFLFGHGFAKILKKEISEVRSLKNHLSGPYCMGVLEHLITSINNKLAVDIRAIIQAIRAQNLRKHAALTSGAASGSVATSDVKKPSVSPSLCQDSDSPGPRVNRERMSPGEHGRVLRGLSSELQQAIQNGILYDEIRFPRFMLKELPRPEIWESLTALIAHELRQQRPKGIKHKIRRKRLLANAAWFRHEYSKTYHARQGTAAVRARLRLMLRWRINHVLQLKIYQRAGNKSIGAQQRARHLRTVIKETTKSIKHLQSRIVSGHSGGEDETDMSGPAVGELETETYPKLRPASLPDTLLYQLSRELLDSLNEAAFDFGQREASDTMQRHHWTTPESIDLPIFVSSFHLYPDLFHRFVEYEEVLRRLREFRNQYAHGSVGMTAGDVSLVLDDLAAAARLFQSSDLSAKVEQYHNLLAEFATAHTKHLKRAFRLIRSVRKGSDGGPKETSTVPKDFEPISTSATMQSMASEAAHIKEAWTHAQQSLLEVDTRKINKFVGESQIRRIIKYMGRNAAAVLSEIQKDQCASREDSEDATDNQSIRKITEVLRRELAQPRRAPNTNGRRTEAGEITMSSELGHEKPTPEFLELLPSTRFTPTENQASKQKGQLRQLAESVRKGT